MSYDIKIFNVCDHIIDEKIYERSLCPRCYGKGYYFDIHFDIVGQTVLADGSIKLQQEMLKIVLDTKFQNVFHPLWGSQVNSLIGSKNININRSKLETIIRTTLEYLKSVQVNENFQWNNINDDELLNDILSIEITPLKPDGYYVTITVSNNVDETFTQSIII